MKDRSGEFFSTAEVIRKHSPAATDGSGKGVATAAKLPPRCALYKSSHALSLAAKDAESKVQRLSRLAARRGLFDDPAAEVNALTALLKADLQKLDTSLRSFLSEAVRQTHGNGVIITALGAASDIIGLGSSGPGQSSPRAFWLCVGEVLKVHVMDDTRGFHAALRARGESMKAAAAQRSQYARSTWAPSAAALDSPLFAPPPLPPPPPPMAPSGVVHHMYNSGPAAGPPSHYASNASSSSTSLSHPSSLHTANINSNGSGPPPPPIGLGRPPTMAAVTAAPNDGLRRRGLPPVQPLSVQFSFSSSGASSFPAPSGSTSIAIASLHGDSGTGGLGQQQQGASAYAPRYPAGAYAYSAAQVQAYHASKSRADEMRSVEASLSELGHMFNRLAGLVAEQGETVERIDADMEVALDNVQAGHSELLGYYESASKNRGLILKVFAVLAGVILLFAVFR